MRHARSAGIEGSKSVKEGKMKTVSIVALLSLGLVLAGCDSSGGSENNVNNNHHLLNNN